MHWEYISGNVVREWPERDKQKRSDLIAAGKCPECGGCLDTGWECTDCGHDAMPSQKSTPRT